MTHGMRDRIREAIGDRKGNSLTPYPLPPSVVPHFCGVSGSTQIQISPLPTRPAASIGLGKVNEHEADRIAHAVAVLRPDWPVLSIRTLITTTPTLMARPRRDVMVAFSAIACDSETKTPKRVTETGPWWHAAAAAAGDNHQAPTRAYPPKLEDACELHGGWATNCPGCAAEQLAQDGRATRPAEKGTSETSLRVANLRNLIRPCTATDRDQETRP